MIAPQFENEDFRFCLMRDKIPIGSIHSWNCMKFHDHRLISHIENGGNVAVIARFGFLVILDYDTKDVPIDLKLLNTFVEETARGYHAYFLANYNINHVGALGEIRAKDQHAVIAPSIHVSGFRYCTYIDKPIRELTLTEFKEIMEPFLVRKEYRNSITCTDNSRSGREFGLCIEHIKRGIKYQKLSGSSLKAYVFNRMSTYDRWSKSIANYRERTYNNALRIAENEVAF